MPNLRTYAREAATRAGCDPDLFERQIQQESGFDPDAFNAGSGATGIAQIVSRFHPDVDPRDPIASLDYAAGWMARLHRQYGTYRKALAAYNWGPGNVAGWDGTREGLPAETRRYLDVILGDGWTEPDSDGSGTIPLSDTAGGTSAGEAGASGAGPDAVLRFRVARAGADRLNLRAEPDRSAAVLDRLRDGTLLEPLGPARDAGSVTWVQVRAPGDATGWVAASFLDIVAAAPTAPARPVEPATPARPDRLPQPDAASVSYRVNADDVRLRKRPGTGANAPILTMLRSGTVVEDDGGEVVNASGFDWRRVRVDGRAGWIATQLLSPVTASRFPFVADTPTELQAQDWTCSIRSVMWMLKSIGVPVTPAEAQDAMSPRYVNSDVGLLDASGAGVVAVLRDRWGVEAFNRAPVSFDEVAGWAGTCPVAIGGRNWGHWTAVRGFKGDRLVLANPGGTGPRFGQQTLSRQQFADLGWFSAVVIPIE